MLRCSTRPSPTADPRPPANITNGTNSSSESNRPTIPRVNRPHPRFTHLCRNLTFCREQKFSEYSFYWWRRQAQRFREQPIRFALVETTMPTTETPRPRQAQTQLELVLNSGERLRMPADAATLRLVLGVLREQGKWTDDAPAGQRARLFVHRSL